MTNLEYLRRLQNLSQVELASKLKCHPSVISKLENGWQSKLSQSVARRLSRLFNEQVEQLLAEYKPPDPRLDAA